METIGDYARMKELMKDGEMVLFYLSRPNCGVCSALKPKVLAMIESNFPEIRRYYVNLDEIPEAGGQLSVFTIPAVLVYSKGKELIREARYISIDDLTEKIRRPYALLFGESS